MVFGGICADDKTQLVFVNEGAKINPEYYIEQILESEQDGEPAQCAKATQQWCEADFHGFINAAEWPASSPDLNPMDFAVWRYLTQQVATKNNANLESLQISLKKAWDDLAVNTCVPSLTRTRRDSELSSRQKRGLGSAEIARRLQISSSTVRILRRHFAGGPFILQQDWAPSHGSRSTLAVLEAHFPGFLDKNLWPASSPDLNPMDFSVWGMLEGKIAGKVFATVDDLKAALENMKIPVDYPYAIAPQHDGVFPVHEQMFDAWKKVWNVSATATEEYPHFKPSTNRKGFIHSGIHVLPRQTCGLYTHTQLFDEYPEGFEKVQKTLQVRRVSDVIWTDEKIFTIEPLPNRQNQRQLLSKDDSMSPKRRLAHNRLFPKSVMVWAGITATGKTPLVFIERNVKINSEVYQKIVLMDNLLPWVTQHFAGGPFILQQDWAPSHGSRSTLAVLEAHFPGFLDKNLWPASSPDLNPMDFSVWGMLEGKIAGKVFATVDDLKAALEVAWASIDDGYLRRTVNSVKKRLRACVKARGSNFEILLSSKAGNWISEDSRTSTKTTSPLGQTTSRPLTWKTISHKLKCYVAINCSASNIANFQLVMVNLKLFGIAIFFTQIGSVVMKVSQSEAEQGFLAWSIVTFGVFAYVLLLCLPLVCLACSVFASVFLIMRMNKKKQAASTVSNTAPSSAVETVKNPPV
uniref:HSNSD domain-containing protein n=5 Tax=Caenorhabditis japonica TaxID=281687 RepID=A0A8R1I5P4_CAEJA